VSQENVPATSTRIGLGRRARTSIASRCSKRAAT